MPPKPSYFNLSSLLALAVLFIVSLSVGVADFSWRYILPLSGGMRFMLVSHLSRTLALVSTGVSMAVTGMIMQILMRNRFVEPSMIGASQSVALGLLLMSLFFLAAALMGKMVVVAAVVLAGILLFTALIRRLPPTVQLMVLLMEIIFGGVTKSAAVFIGYETDMPQMLGIWQQGDFFGVLLGRYKSLRFTGMLALVAYLIADRLTTVGLGEIVSVNLGLNRNTILWSGLVTVALIISLVVVIVGNIPFIGLVVPNIINRITGDRPRRSLPAVALLGASSVLLCGIIGCVIVFPFGIPVSVVFGVAGMALFLRLLLRKFAHAV